MEASHANVPQNSLASRYTASQPSTRPSRKHLLAVQESRGGGSASSAAHPLSPTSNASSEPLPEHHQDAGPLGRSPSGRLPPAYGDQTPY
ncbi:hypothetical protein FIBSPDRAFT_850956 [Athelia psychrophila]|uniref:Uncharacterized protein n=1 Tax=Athelia psychrophila TaxID=1759441 RepID=A0A166T5T2_9AGAM|nr:hypothetical protein FIBSPDRAFT_850956 [Fibularhizoctonia sp. CBS 109695]